MEIVFSDELIRQLALELYDPIVRHIKAMEESGTVQTDETEA